MNTGYWHETLSGGQVMKVAKNDFLARPFNKVGMNSIKNFNSFTKAYNYAETGVE